MLHLLCCIRLYSTPCQIFFNNHLWCSGLKQRQNTNFMFHKAPQEKGEGNQIWRWHTPQSGLLLTRPLLWQLHIHECWPLTVDVRQSSPCWKSLVWHQYEQLEKSNTNYGWKKMKSLYCKIYGMKFRIFFMCATQQVEHITNLHRVCEAQETSWVALYNSGFNVGVPKLFSY